MLSLSVFRTACPSIAVLSVVVLVVVVTFLEVVEATTSTPASDLHRLWEISYPNATYIAELNTVVMDYGMSPELNADVNVRTKIYANYDCEGPALTEGILLDEVKPATGEHIIKLDIHTLIQNPAISTIDYDDGHGMIKFCLYYSLWTGNEDDDIEINSLYNLLRIYLSMDNEFSIDGFLVTESPDDDDYNAGGRHKHHEKERHYLDVYLCSHVTFERISAPVGGYGMGDVLSICCEASQSIIDDGVFLKGVDNFLWTRTVYRGPVAYVTEQWAVKDGVPDGVSTYHCPMYALFCTFTTMLNAEFFSQEGFVTGQGTANLGFGVRKLEGSSSGGVGTIISTTSSTTTSTTFEDDDSIIPDEEISITIRTPQGITSMPKTRFMRALEEKPNADNSNMSILIPIKGPGERPEMMIRSTGNHNNNNNNSDDLRGNEGFVSTGTMWGLISIFIIVIVIGGYLAWREWKLGKLGEEEDTFDSQ